MLNDILLFGLLCPLKSVKCRHTMILYELHRTGAKSMSDIHPKKLVILYILDILQKYTDEEHRLSQKEIQDILKREYEMTVDRKAVKRNLLNLIEYGSNIEYREVSRKDIFRKKILYHIKAPRILRIKKSRKTICYGRILPEAEIHE